ncbi:amino acid adenylation domain-containing protein [Poronia punctata]|nr:amino acid adenylation domain-containing protein [Poronia punctata]
MPSERQKPLYPEGLSILNPNPKRLPGPCLLHELVSVTGRDGISSAVDFLSKDGKRITLSYQELHVASSALAARIRSSTVSMSTLSPSEPRDPLIVPILCSQSPQLYIAILAVLKAGAAFCPLNTDAPPDRLRFILQDVKAKLVLADQGLVSKLPSDDLTCDVISIDHALQLAGNESYKLDNGCPVGPDDAAYVMYTSGSTGTPKGVCISHLAASQSILAHEGHIPTFSRFLQFAAPTFDVSVFEIFFPLFRGVTLVGCHRGEMLTDLPGVLRVMEVDACELTPSVAGSLLKQRSRAPELRLLMTIGEMLTEPIIQEFGGTDDKLSMLWAMYGPTEATIHCTLHPSLPSSSGRNTIGQPLDTVSAFITRIPTDNSLTSQFEILPVGEVGELALGGSQLATGYLNRPEQTQVSFIQTGWGRLYRTGDKAKFRSDGTIECLGRIDDSQVKLNGQRLELGEIESALLRTPGCHSAFVTIISNALIAFVAMEKIPESGAILLEQCRSWLPAFMVPTDIVMLKQLPQLPSGKIDRKRLICDYASRNANGIHEEGEVLDDDERFLCEAATTILGQRIGPLTEFSPASLDSLAAIEYASLLRERGADISVMDILIAKTPRELRERVGSVGNPTKHSILKESLSSHHRPSMPSSDILKLKATLGEQVNRISRLEPSTTLQQSMIAETLKDACSYINQIKLKMPPGIAINVLLSSLRTLAERNEILRTGFAFIDNQLCQVIWDCLEEGQIHETSNTDEQAGTIENTDLFLLRPLKIEIRCPSRDETDITVMLTVHHAIYDGWTMDLIIEDLWLLLQGKPPIPRPQFSQISQRLDNMPVENVTTSMEFWTGHLQGVDAASLPSLNTVVASDNRRSTKVTALPLKSKVLTDFTRQASIGPQVVFQACLAWLLAAIHGSNDVVIGCVSSGRSLPVAGIDKTMGPFMTTLPLRINISRHRTILELLHSIQSMNREALRYGHVPLSQINKAAGLSANSKLFDVIFAYQESAVSRKRGSNAVQELWHRDVTEAKLVVEIQPWEDHFICQTTSRPTFLPESVVEAFTSHLAHLITYVTGHVDSPVASIAECFPSSHLSSYNDSPTSVETACTLSAMVESSVQRYSSAAALSFMAAVSHDGVTIQTLSYSDLNSKANQIARHLQKHGVVSGGVIAIIMEKSPLLYCGILAILKTGCAYLPILPSTPTERVKDIFHQADPCLCLIDEVSSRLRLCELPTPTVALNAEIVSSYSDVNIEPHGQSSDLAYVIYTSGTTGRPKGVAVTNKNILSNISVLSDIYPHTTADRMLQACSQAFDVSVFEIFFAWANGMCLCAATNDTLFKDFERSVRALEITHLSLTVTVASLLNPDNVPSVGFLVTSGEAMTHEVLDKWAQYLYQGYGPSETTNICTVRKVSRGDSPRFLGWAFDNTSTFVMYPKSPHLVPFGCAGELCFGGDQIASGYLRLPEATATSFIDHSTYGRLYRSGDLGRMLPDGSLLIEGRIDKQVKLRGLRIDLLEIESAAKTTGIARMFRSALFRHEATKTTHLALFYIYEDDKKRKFELLPLSGAIKEHIQALRQNLEARLPGYMVPTFIFPVSSLAMTSSGKTDDRALCGSVSNLTIDQLSAYGSANEVGDMNSDWSKTETLVADVVAKVLGRDRSEMNRWTTFPALGIDSISAMPVARELQRLLQKPVNLSLLLQNPSVSRLASAIDRTKNAGEPSQGKNSMLPTGLVESLYKRFEKQGKSALKVLPCTPLQEAMVMASSNPLSSTSEDERVPYYNQTVLSLRVPYEAMIRHWNEIIQRHEILRACFITTDNIRHPVVQVILGDHTPRWEIFQANYDSLHEGGLRHRRSVSTLTGRFEPPLSLAIIRTRDYGDLLSFICHHAMYDGVSMQIILSEVESVAKGIQLPPAPSLEPFLREIQLSPTGRDDFWRELFFNFDPAPLKIADSGRDGMPRSIYLRASTMPLSQMESQLRGLGVSMLAMCQTAWAVTLSMLSSRRDLCFGNVVAGRSVSLDMMDRIVAPCFNTVPVRIDLSRCAFLIEAVKSFQAQNAKMIQFQFTSLRHVQNLVDTETRLFDTLLILQPHPVALDESLWTLEYEDGAMDVPIVCELVPTQIQDTLALQLHRDISKIPYRYLQVIGNIFSHVVDTTLKFPFSHIPTVEALPPDWQQDMENLFPRTRAPVSWTKSVNETVNGQGSWTTLELIVRKTLSRLTERPEEGIDRLTPIYHYGLDSIGAIQLATLLREERVNVSGVDVIQNPTCAGIAAATRDHAEQEESSAYDFDTFRRQIEGDIADSLIDLRDVEAIFPCTATQQGLLFKFLDSKGGYYFNFSSWALDLAAKPDAVQWAWAQLASRQQILRTGFIPVNHPDSSFAMVVYKPDHFDLPVSSNETGNFDLERWRSKATADTLKTLARPAWQVVLATSEAEGDVAPLTVHLAIHHALYDAFTLKWLLADLDALIRHINEPKMTEMTKIEDALAHYFNLSRSGQSAGDAFWRSKAGDYVFHRFPVMTPCRIEGPVVSTVSHSCSTPSSSLRRAASKFGVTMQAVLQATMVRILSAYVGESRVTLGVVLEGRTTDLARKATIPMMTTLPVIADNVVGDGDLIRQMMKYNAEIRSFQFMPISQIQRCLGVDGTVFDTILVYQSMDGSMTSSSLRLLSDVGSVEYPVSLEVEELSDDTTQLNLTFDTSILPSEQGIILLKQFEAILEGFLFPDKKLTSGLAIGRPHLLSVLPPKHSQLPADSNLLHGLMENSARLTPSAVALEFVSKINQPIEARKWTYQELDNLGNQVAQLVVRHGVEPGSIVATCFDKCPVAYFTLLGILKAGCTFLCLDPSAPSARQRYILEDSNAALLLVGEEYNWTCQVQSLSVCRVDESLLGSLPIQCPALSRRVLSSDSCYCLYTSGTTGTPKGCLITHENAVQAMAAFKVLFTGRWDSSSRWLQFAAFHFDVSILEQYWSWWVGITVVAAPKDVILGDLAGTISNLAITHIDLTPSLARLITPADCPSLCRGVFITGGEKLRADVLQTWGPEEVIHNAYGPTEATIGVTMYCGMPQNGRPSNIGNLFPNVGAYVFEPGTETAVLRGGVGELCLAGKLVGKGYLNRDTLTGERFPILQESGERVYRTGDLVRVLHDDSFDFLGRADDQVKLRGQRLEIGEINHSIKESLPDKKSDVATVVTRWKNQNTDLLVSFIALSSDASSKGEVEVYHDQTHTEVATRAYDVCRSRLATYMVPSFILCVSRIPLSTNNKVDVHNLRKIFSDLSQQQLQAIASSSTNTSRDLTELERRVLGAFHAVTGGIREEEVGPSSTIYQLGIDSITVPRLANQLRAMGFMSATPALILQNSQISRLSKALEQYSPATCLPGRNMLQFKQRLKSQFHRYLGSSCTTLGVEGTEVEYIAPCTPLQQGILARSKRAEARAAYFNQFKICLAPGVSIDLLKAAFARVMSSYPILRTAFIDTPDGHLQVALKNRSMRWFELRGTEEMLNDFASERRHSWAEENHEVVKWPVEIDHIVVDNRHYLLLRLFHAVYDARSLRIILDGVSSEYEGIPCSSDPTFLSVLAEGPLLDHHASHPFWRELLKNHQFQTMPSLVDGPKNAAIASTITQSHSFPGLEDRRKALEVTHQTLLQAAWLRTLRRYLVHPPTIGVVLSGRSLAIDKIDRVVGPLFNTLPFRVDDMDGMSWAALASKIQEENNSLLAFVHTPLREIQKLCSNGQPLFDTLFTFDRVDIPEHDNKHSLWTVEDSDGSPDYPLAIEVIMGQDGRLEITLAAQGAIADRAALDSLLHQFKLSLESIIASPNEIPETSEGKERIPNGDDIPLVAFDRPVTSGPARLASSTFEWDEHAHKVRRELATFTAMGEEDIFETTNLFSLGLDSIDVIKFAGRLAKLGYQIPVSALMKQPTLEATMDVLRKPQSSITTETGRDTRKLDKTISMLEHYYHRANPQLPDVEAILPPTPLQDSMIAEMLQSGFQTYFNHDVLELPPTIDVNRLKSTLSTVYANTPILRTVFVEVDDARIKTAYCQVVRAHELEFPPSMDIPHLADISAITDLARSNAVRGNGTSGLFQVHFVTCQTVQYMVLSMSHALYDGFSLQLLHSDIQAAYYGAFTPRPSSRAYLAHMLSISDSSSQAYWRHTLSGARPTLLAKRESIQQGKMVHRAERYSKRNAADLRDLCKRLHITPQVLGQGCWAAVLSSLTKCLDVVFGVVLSGRNTEEARELMFPTMNTVPLWLALHGSVVEFLDYLQNVMSTVLEYQHTPLREIQKYSNSKDQLLNTIFIFQDGRGSSMDGEKTFFKSIYSLSAVDYPLCAELELGEKDAIWRVAGDSDYLTCQQVEEVGDLLESVLDYFATDIDAQILNFDLDGSAKVSVCGLEPLEVQAQVQPDSPAQVTNDHDIPKSAASLDSKEVDVLLQVLADLTGVNKGEIGLDMSVYHIGLDSISAIKASSMLRNKGYQISPRDLITTSSIRRILDRMSATSPAEVGEDLPHSLHLDFVIDNRDVATLIRQAGIDVGSTEAILPALPMQVHMLSIWQNTYGTTFFPRFSFRVSGDIGLATISEAWVTLVSEFAMLRTHFVATASPDLPFLQVLLDPAVATKQARTTTTSSKDGIRWEFVYAAAPFAVAHFVGDGDGVELHLHIHHALYDGISLPLILNRFVEICSAPSSSTRIVEKVSWCEFVMKHISPSVQTQREEFWKSYLSGDECFQILGDPQPQSDPTPTERLRLEEFRSIPIKSMAGLGKTVSKHGISTQSLFYAVYARVIARLHQNRDDDIDVVFGVYLANRSSHPETPFPTLNILPVRTRNPLTSNIVDLAAQIQRDISEIGNEVNVTASAWEIGKWTGVKVDTCVNILSKQQQLDEGQSESEIRLKKMRGGEGLDVSTHLIPWDSESLCPNVVRDAYLEGVDIEMALRDDILDIGVFGSSRKLTPIQARELIGGIVDEIERF